MITINKLENDNKNNKFFLGTCVYMLTSYVKKTLFIFVRGNESCDDFTLSNRSTSTTHLHRHTVTCVQKYVLGGRCVSDRAPGFV
jgi:hypothetical protein